MALRRFNAGGKKQKELTEEQKQEIKEAFGQQSEGMGSSDIPRLRSGAAGHCAPATHDGGKGLSFMHDGGKGLRSAVSRSFVGPLIQMLITKKLPWLHIGLALTSLKELTFEAKRYYMYLWMEGGIKLPVRKGAFNCH